MKTSLSLTLGILSVAALAACSTQRVATVSTPAAVIVPATSTTTVMGATAVPFNAADTHFIAVAAGAGMYEVEAARLALTRAGSPQVRSFAQMLLDQHTAANRELMAMVGSKGHKVAPGMPAELQAKLNTLAGTPAANFDHEFIRTTGVADHMATIAEFEKSRSSVGDRDLRAFIDKTLPTLRTHLQQAQDLAGRMAG